MGKRNVGNFVEKGIFLREREFCGGMLIGKGRLLRCARNGTGNRKMETGNCVIMYRESLPTANCQLEIG